MDSVLKAYGCGNLKDVQIDIRIVMREMKMRLVNYLRRITQIFLSI